MEKKRATNGKFKAFLKKNVYYIIMAVCILAIAAMLTVTLVTRNKTSDDPNLDVGPGVVDPGPDNNDEQTNPPETDVPGSGDDVNPPPVSIVFSLPVSNANVTNDFTMDTLVWHNTLRHYAVHNGIDFAGNDGENVMSVYAGTVSNIKYDALNGYVVTIKHNDNLSTSYGSLNEPTVAVGQTVSKGQVIGTMGITATNEYLDGAHVHFCLFENGEIANPYSYFPDGDK